MCIQVTWGFSYNADSDSASLEWRPEILHFQQVPRWWCLSCQSSDHTFCGKALYTASWRVTILISMLRPPWNPLVKFSLSNSAFVKLICNQKPFSPPWYLLIPHTQGTVEANLGSAAQANTSLPGMTSHHLRSTHFGSWPQTSSRAS